MGDITNLFKATVKTVRTRNKAQGLASGPNKSILGHPKGPKSQFTANAKEVVQNINKLRDFLLEHRKDYINAASHLGAQVSGMTDAERDQIDIDAQTFIRACSEAIQIFRSKEHDQDLPQQVKEHRAAVFSIIEKHLKGVCNIYSEQKAVRVKRVVDKKRLGRLEPEGKARLKTKTAKSGRDRVPGGQSTGASSPSGQDRTVVENGGLSSEVALPPIVFEEEEEDLSPEEAQMFELENQQMYEEMNSLMNEVRQVEGKVVEIARLQEIFADKVLEQDKDVDRIADTVVGATEDIKGANDEIREAMKNNAGLRVWILFFLIMCSFSLLFLDWYNP